MASLGDILRRFRFHGVPGAPARAGVPADRAAELETELAPVFSLLEAAQRHADELIRRAAADAARRRAEGSEHARRIVARAHVEAEAARTESAAVRLARAEGEMRALLAEAAEEAARIERVASQRTPALVDELVRRALAMGGPPGAAVTDPTADPPQPAGGDRRP